MAIWTPQHTPTYKQGFARCAAESKYPGLWDGLVGLWAPSLGPTGLTLFDWSGYHNDGTLTGGLTWAMTDRGYATRATAHSQHIAGGSVVLGAEDFSISTWARRNVDTGDYDAPRLYGTGSAAGAWMLSTDGFTTLRFYGNGGGIAASTAAGAFLLGVWYHIVVVRSGATVTLYLDTVSKATDATASDDLSSTAAFQIYNAASAADRSFHGDIKNLLIYNRALAPSEIQQLYAVPHALTTPRSKVFAAAVAPGGNAPTGHVYGPLVGPLGGAI